MACPTGASQAPERFSALRPPLDAGERSKVASPGRRNAPRERDGLFDIVRWKLPKTVRRRAASSALVVPAKAGTHDHRGWFWVPALRPLCGRRPGRRSFLGTKHQPVAVGNGRRLGFPVSGLLFTGNAANFNVSSGSRVLCRASLVEWTPRAM